MLWRMCIMSDKKELKELSVKDYEKIDQVMADFDFENAVKILNFMKDSFPKDHYIKGIDMPTVQELMEVGRRHLKNVIQENLIFCSSRFLTAYKIEYTDYPNDYQLGLILDVIESNVEPEEN